MRRFLPLVVFALIVSATPALAAVPQTMSYQGVLTDGAGHILPDGNYSVTFRIYDDPTLSGVHLLWTEAHDGVTAPQVTVVTGSFSTVLGSAIPITVMFNTPMWIEVQLGANPPFLPRIALTPAPYALNARNIFDGGASNFVGVGRSSRVSGAEYFGVLAPVASGYGGMYVQTQGASSLPFYGYYTGTDVAWTYLDGADPNKSWRLYNNGDRLVVTNTGNVGLGVSTPTTNLDVAGGTRLGAGAPAIKMMKLTTTSAATQGASVTVATGLGTSAKILSIDVRIQYTGDGYVPPGYSLNPGYQFTTLDFFGTIYIYNLAGNSANILSKPVVILVTYEE